MSTPVTVAIADIHGHLDTALSLLTRLPQTDIVDTAIVEQQGDHFNWIGGDSHRIILNGDMFDRGKQSSQALQFAFDLLDTAEQQGCPERVRYHLGNHEVFALFPETNLAFEQQRGNSREQFEQQGEASYWWTMDEATRQDLARRVADGSITAITPVDDIFYSHAGRVPEPDPRQLNTALQEIGDRIHGLKGDDRHRATQELLADDRYRNVIGHEDSIVWTDLQRLVAESTVTQAVGHTRLSNTDWDRLTSANPQRIDGTILLDSITDYQNSVSSSFGCTVQTGQSVHAVRYDGSTIHTAELYTT